MQGKLFQVRDRMTCIHVVATRFRPTHPIESRMLAKAGYGLTISEQESWTLVHKLGSTRACTDPYQWADRTMSTAHNFIAEHWAELNSGDVVDVEYILGETSAPKDFE